ncbi:MAG: glycosyltransferase family 2 protein, partial [Bacteroidales bacterium]
MPERDDICVIIPTYNNASTLPRVIDETLGFCDRIIVVNDGSADNTVELLRNMSYKPEIISYSENKGKGYALKRAFSFALARGYRYAITLDADGQHYPSDIPRFLEALEKNPGAVILGSRLLKQK